MTAPWMPPLPDVNGNPYAAIMVAACRAYGLACARAALEQAAKVCDSVNNYDNPMTATDCAAAIRALAKEITP